MKINPQLAQSIVNKMMAQIPYNVNMMDAQGVIIASGDPARIQTLHVGAVDAIQQRKTLPMDRSFGQHGQPGVNMPVFFENEVIGVIGITGDPAKVTPLASLLRVATELLVSQDQSNQVAKQRENSLNRFLYEWSQVTDHLADKTDLLAAAHRLGIDVFKDRQAIAMTATTIPAKLLDPSDFQTFTSATTLVVFTFLPATIQRLTTYCAAHHIALGIGKPTQNLATTIAQASRTRHISALLNRPDFIRYQQVAFIDHLLTSQLTLPDVTPKFTQLAQTSSGQELIETIDLYVRYHRGNLVQTAKALHIHRNTLTYRLDRINEIFGLDPRNSLDLFELYLGAILFRNESAGA